MPVYDQEEIGYMELMKLLIDKGANVNARLGKRLWFRSFFSDQSWVDPAGATPFWRAAQSSDVEAMKFLMAHGADARMATNTRRGYAADGCGGSRLGARTSPVNAHRFISWLRWSIACSLATT